MCREFQSKGYSFNSGGLVGRTLGDYNLIDSYWVNTGTDQAGVKSIPVTQKQRITNDRATRCGKLDCVISVTDSSSHDFAYQDIIFPTHSWGGSIYTSGLQRVSWVFPSLSYPALRVTDADGESYLPGGLEQVCAYSDSSFDYFCDLEVLPKFPQSHYSFTVDLSMPLATDADNNILIGTVVSEPRPSEIPSASVVANLINRYVILDPTSIVSGISSDFSIDTNGSITYDGDDLPATGTYNLHVAVALEVSISPFALYETAGLEIYVINDGTSIADSYTQVPVDANPDTGRGSGTLDDPYLISNVYQLQAIAGVDHLSKSSGSILIHQQPMALRHLCR